MLATSKLESFAIFLYADLQWTTGDGSFGTDGLGGTEALAGINAGDGINSVTIPGSLSPSIINLVTTSNVGVPGVWVFKIGQGCEFVRYTKFMISLISSLKSNNLLTVGSEKNSKMLYSGYY